MNIYLFPTEMEATPFRELMPTADVVISGVGMAATAATLARLHGEGRLAGRRVVLAGIAGAYEGRAEVGSVVEVVAECCSELPERFRRCYAVKASTKLRRVSANSVHHGVDDSLGADVENMEGAALFALAEVWNFVACEVRAISNRVGEPFASWRVDEALVALARELQNIEQNE